MSEVQQTQLAPRSDVSKATPTRILIIEDEIMIGILLEDELSDMGHEVLTVAASLEAAVKAASEESFDIALLDVNLAGKNTERVAEILEKRKLPFIFCTGYEGFTNLNHAVLIKPFDAQILKLAIDLALERARTWRVAESLPV